MNRFFFFLAATLALVACQPNDPEEQVESNNRIHQLDSLGWDWESRSVVDFSKAAYSISTDEVRLHFYGWELDEDSLISVTFPDNTNQYGRVWLTYRMCGWNKGPAEWDMTTMIKIYDRANDQWLEFVRAITPYGGSFGATWEKQFCIDVTEFLPLLKGKTDFRIFYCGWDATDTHAHAMQMTFSFFDEKNRYGEAIGRQKVYDSTLPNDGNNGYRAWAYGVKGWSIEDESRLGNRTIDIPAGTKHVLLRVCITGHGQDAYNGGGTFPNRTPQKAKNCAEFDSNFYKIFINDEQQKEQGLIWELNSGANNYKQAGTYTYSRAGWGPGKPCNVQHWLIKGIPAEGEKLTLNFDLDEYISPCTKPNDAYVPCYYVMADAFFYK